MLKSIRLLLIMALMAMTFAAPAPARADNVITVTTSTDEINDDAACSLREALINANDNALTHDECGAGSGNDTIVFANGITTITLGSALPTIYDPDGLTIHGGGDVTLSGNEQYRVLIVQDTPLTLDSITIADGTCDSCSGGGIYSNHTGDTGLTILNSTITNNTGEFSSGIYDINGTVIIANSTISNNEIGSYGGGIIKTGAGTLTITNSIFSGNTSTASAGGGAIYTDSPTTISNSLFTNNHVPNGLGGAIYNQYSVTFTIADTIFTNNSASRGGAVFNGVNDTTTAVITGSTFSDNFTTTNSTNQGGALYLSGWGTTSTGTVSIANSTFSGNTADDDGGAIYNYHSRTTIINSTFSGNVAVYGNHLSHWSENNTLNLYNSILANSDYDCYVVNPNTIAGNNNLIEDSLNACGFADGVNGNIVGSDPNLGGLTGSPAYFPLNTGSPALDAGDNTQCDAAPVSNTSQNGVSRPQGSQCDIGSFEKIAIYTSTVKSNGAQDGWILESTETSNKGGTLNKGASTLNVGDDTANKQYRAVLSFNTSTLPAGAVITKVTLKVRRQGVTGGGNPITTFNGFMVDLKKGNFGTSALQTADFQTTANKTLSGLKPKLVSGWYAMNLTTAKAQINLTGSTQIRLRFKLDDNNNSVANFLKLHSGNSSATSRPQLIVEYFIP